MKTLELGKEYNIALHGTWLVRKLLFLQVCKGPADEVPYGQGVPRHPDAWSKDVHRTGVRAPK